MGTDWKTWCRLCAKQSENQIDIFIKNENLTSIADSIQRYFSIAILDTDTIPTKICNGCYDIVMKVINFTFRSAKVQDLFNELQFQQNLEIDLNKLRIKYGLTHEVYESKLLIDSQHEGKQQKIMKLNEVPKGTILSENFEDFLQPHDTNFDDDKIVYDDTIETSEDEKSLVKLKIKKKVILEKQGIKLKRRSNIIPEEVVESKLSKKDSENEFEANIKMNTFKEETEEIAELHNGTKYSTLAKNTTRRNQSIKVCGICYKNFNSKANYYYHMRTKHNIVQKTQSVMCKTCGKTFKKQSKLEDHENMHLPPEKRKWYTCPQCGKKFAEQTSIQSHIRVVHILEKTFICEECGKTFGTIDQLNSHKVVHSDFIPFKCSMCPKSFKRLPSLKNHIDSHEDTKHICPICGCQLNTKTILRRHMVIHSDEKKYKCNFCQKEFKRTKALKNHLILHTGLKPYQCPFCDQTFANGSTCRNHQKNSHPTELATMEQSGEKKSCKNVPRLEHLKAVNNAAVVNTNKKTSNVSNQDKFYMKISNEMNLGTTITEESQIQLPLNSIKIYPII